MEFQFTILDMRIKPMIFLFFIWLLWGGYVVQSVNSQSRNLHLKNYDEKMTAQGEVLQWFFQERTLSLKSLKDDEPFVSRYSVEDWKQLGPWKAIAFLKDRSSSLYGPFEKMMPAAHRDQLIKKIKNKLPVGRIDGVHWEAFQWNGTPFIAAYVSRIYGTQVFLAQATDWGQSLSFLSSENGWSLVNRAGTIIFHSDIRYIGEKRPDRQKQQPRELSLASTNLVAALSSTGSVSSRSFLVQITLVSLGFFIISLAIMTQVFKSEKSEQLASVEQLKIRLQEQYSAKVKELEVVKPEPKQEVEERKQELFFKDLSHRVASSLGRQLQPAFMSLLGHSQWLESVSQNRSEEEVAALQSMVREAKGSKEILDKLLSVAGESEFEKFPMKLETPLLRSLKKWQTTFEIEQIQLEKKIDETSFYPLHSDAIEKALDHIIQNAAEAMTRQANKVISVSLTDDQDMIRLTITDNGSGIESEDLAKISDPFFTTKAHMSRLGLGLTEAFGLLKQHHAIVSVTSQIGVGTRFEICFDKNEAQRVLKLSEKRKQTAEAEGRIVIPMNLPQPLEEAGADEMIATELAAVDQEIEKLLDFSSLDFIESPMKTNEEDQENDLATSIKSENFLDENPIRGQNA